MRDKLKVFTAFSGYDSQCLALNRLKDYAPGFDYELVGWSEIDKAAIKAHNALFPDAADKNYGDISKVDWKETPDFDLFTYSSPCTDFSSAGLQLGGKEGSGTRSSLLWECRKTIEAKRPKYCLFENVLGLLQEKFFPYFEKWIKLINSYGYNSYYKVCNSKDYGVGQNRPRIFLVSIRKDVDLIYTFPGEMSTRPHLYEYLEPDETIEKKYFLNEKRLPHYMGLNKDAMERLECKENKTSDYDVVPCGVYCHSSDNFNSPPIRDLSRCLKAECRDAGVVYKKNGEWNMRLFTTRESFRLMGLTDKEIDIVNEGCPSKEQQKRMAGNSIVVDVIFHLFRKMFIDTEPDKGTQYVLF